MSENSQLSRNLWSSAFVWPIVQNQSEFQPLTVCGMRMGCGHNAYLILNLHLFALIQDWKPTFDCGAHWSLRPSMLKILIIFSQTWTRSCTYCTPTVTRRPPLRLTCYVSASHSPVSFLLSCRAADRCMMSLRPRQVGACFWQNKTHCTSPRPSVTPSLFLSLPCQEFCLVL